MKKFAVINIKSTKFQTSNEVRVVECLEDGTFKSLLRTQNGAITDPKNKRFNCIEMQSTDFGKVLAYIEKYRPNVLSKIDMEKVVL